jgi:hypothetical protein
MVAVRPKPIPSYLVMSRRHQKIRPSGVTGSADEIKESFRAMVKRIPCPHCSESFTDGAVTWGDSWLAGNIEKLREEEIFVRDGPFKVKCEWCEGLSLINYFAGTASKA